MRGLILSLGMATLLLAGCARHCGDTTLYQLSGRQKPIVAVLPVIDQTSGCNLTWDLSREFTDEIRNRVYDSKRIYLLRDGSSLEIAKQLSTPNPREIAPEAIHSLGAAEYALVAEIIKQDGLSSGSKHQSSAQLSRPEIGSILTLGLRVRVIDMRHETPKIILQEVLDQDFMVATAYMHCDYSKMPWGTEAFTRTPMGIAHNRLVRELVARVEAYIEAAQ